jgi:isoprenylcysteine carboxyl methyltransferase (ICMT) family protein YpbQ
VLSYGAIALWGALTGLRLLQAQQANQIIPAFLALQSGAVAYRLVFRQPHRRISHTSKQLVAWASALLPLGMRIQEDTLVGECLTLAGLFLVLWALLVLGNSFGIAPADRGLVVSGPYRFIRHPMYAGELLSIAAVLLSNPSNWNLLIFTAVTICIFLRIRWEELLVSNYSFYASQVPWRLVPKVW